MKTMYSPLLVVTRAKWMLMGLVLAVVLLFPHQDATASQAPVNLGSAGSFAVLAGTTITSTNGGTINGNVGVWPGTTFVVGVPPVIVNGTIHLGDPIAAQAQGDLTTAFNDAAGRTLDAVLISAGDLGGKTLAPGLYKSAPLACHIVSGSYARRPRQPECCLDLPDAVLHTHRVKRPPGNSGRRRRGPQHLLAGRQFSDSGNDLCLQREHPGTYCNHGDDRRQAGRQSVGTECRGYLRRQYPYQEGPIHRSALAAVIVGLGELGD